MSSWWWCWVLRYGRRTTSRQHLTQVSATLTLLSNCSCHQASYRPASFSSSSSTSSSSSSWLRRLRVLSITGAAAGLGRLWIVWGAARKKWPKVEHVQRKRPRPSTPCRHLDLSSIIQGEASRVFQYFSFGFDAQLAFPLFNTISSLYLASLHFNFDSAHMFTLWFDSGGTLHMWLVIQEGWVHEININFFFLKKQLIWK